MQLARDRFVPVAADDWYQRRRNDDEGKFFRGVADQGPRKGEDGSTRQGIYALSPGGKLLAYRNAGQNPAVMREVLKDGLGEWNKLPESERKPGAIEVGEPELTDQTYIRTPPQGGLIVNVYARALDQADGGKFDDAVCKVGSGDEASRDHLWLTETEWKSLVPANPVNGDRFPVPRSVAERILRFHFVDNTRGEPPIWRRDQIRSSNLTVIVEKADRNGIELRVEGSVLLATDAIPDKSERGYDARLLGYLRYDVRKKAFDRFDVVAVGDHWGSGSYTRGARPGRRPLGIAFELARGDSPADRVAPQGAREIREYFGRSD